jgi:hypothetical protein
MTGEGRYREDEVREIFERAATDPGGRALASSEGLTLAELQAIGREVGLDPGRIADAATALELRRGAQPRRTWLGMPVTVGRSVDLPRAPTDEEWERIVADLRQTFSARGKVRTEGNLRRWSNGNLYACVEPTDDGWRLRLGTTKGGASEFNVTGAVLLGAAILVALVMILSGRFAEDMLGPLLLAMGGGGILTYNALQLPAWANERETQMENVATRARALLE